MNTVPFLVYVGIRMTFRWNDVHYANGIFSSKYLVYDRNSYETQIAKMNGGKGKPFRALI